MRSRKSMMVRAALVGAVLGGGLALTSLPAAAEGEACPCWTDAVLRAIEDVKYGVYCSRSWYWDGKEDRPNSAINGARNGVSEWAYAVSGKECSYSGFKGGAAKASRRDLSPAVHKACYDSIVAECQRRGLNFQE